MSKILVIGSGIMGSGIVQSCAQSGHRVTMMDVNEDAMEKAMESIAWSLQKLTEKGKLKEPYEDIMARIDRSKSLELGGDAELVIEAIYEDLETKQKIFKTLARVSDLFLS